MCLIMIYFCHWSNVFSSVSIIFNSICQSVSDFLLLFAFHSLPTACYYLLLSPPDGLWRSAIHEHFGPAFEKIGYCVSLCSVFYDWLQLSCTSLHFVCYGKISVSICLQTLSLAVFFFLPISAFLDFFLMQVPKLNWVKRPLNLLPLLPGIICKRL